MPRQTGIYFRRDTSSNWSTTNPTLAAGEPGYDTSSKVLKIGDGSTAWNSLGAMPLAAVGCKLEKAVAQTLTTGTVTAITFGSSDTEVFDTNGFHSTSTNTSRITIPTGLGGIYIVTAGAGFATSATGARYVSIYKTGAQDANTRVPANAVALSQTLVTASTILSLAAGDYVEMHCFQSSGGNLDVTAGTWTSLSVVLLGTLT